MKKNHIKDHCLRARTLARSFALLLLPLAMASGSLAAAPPAKNLLRIYGTTVTEGNDGIQYAAVTVTLDKASSKPVSVDYRTINGSAVAGSDYDAVSGTLTFAKGQTSKTISVPIRGDRIAEGDSFGYESEYFTVSLSNPTGGAQLGTSTAVVYISDDEPRLSAEYAYYFEGDFGTTPFTFTLGLSRPSDEAVTVDFATEDYTAFAGFDYIATSGTVTFAPGETTQTVIVDVIGDTDPEPDKDFFLTISGVPPSVALISPSVYGFIADDDGYVDPYYYFYYDTGLYYDPWW
jgi:hypothetical protein